MFRKSPKILVAGCSTALLLGLSACGQKGDLVLPAYKADEAARLAQPRPAAPAPAPRAASTANAPSGTATAPSPALSPTSRQP